MKSVYCLLFVSTFYSCNQKKEEKDTIIYPDKWENDMYIEWSYDGGKQDGSWHTIFLSKDSSFIIEGFADHGKKVYINVSQEKLDSLLSKLEYNKIVSFETTINDDSSIIDDLPTSNLTFYMNQEKYEVLENYREQISPKWREQYFRVITFISQVSSSSSTDKISKIYFIPDSTILSSNSEILLMDYGGAPFVKHAYEEYSNDSIEIEMLAGNHKFEVEITDPIEDIVFFDTIFHFKSVPGDRFSMRLSSKNGKIRADSLIKINSYE